MKPEGSLPSSQELATGLWATWIQPTPSVFSSLRFILILSSYICLGLPSGLFPSGFPFKFLHVILISLVRATCPLCPSSLISSP
jgi:hypothetical protein